jgi:hypothetical protein
VPHAAWRRPVTAWAINGHPVRLAERDLRPLVNMLYAPAVWLVLGTCASNVDANRIANRILDVDGGVSDDLIETIADRIAEAYFGRPRWQATVIWRRAMDRWYDVDGDMLSRGVDLMTLPPDRATNVVRKFLIDAARDDKVAMQRLSDALSSPPADVLMRVAKADAARGQATNNFDAAAQLAAAARR